MNGILQSPTFLPPYVLTEGSRRRRSARDRAVLAVAALEWAALVALVLGFVAAGAAVWLG